MPTAYAYYQAGQAVAAVHLGYKIRHISRNPAQAATEIALPKNDPKPHMILWLTGLAAEKKGIGKSSPLRRMRNRARIRAQIEALTLTSTGSRIKRFKGARTLVDQAQDRANAICSALYEAIDQIAHLLAAQEHVEGCEIVAIVQALKAKRAAAGESTGDENQIGT